MNDTVDISIIILNYKTRGLLKQQLRALDREPIPRSETIVVDNASGDESVTMIREQFPAVTLVESERNVGFGSGINIGIRRSVGRYLLIMNPDVAVVPDAVAVLRQFLESHPTVGMVGPKLINPDGSVQTSARRFPSPMTIIYRRTPLGLVPWGRRSLRSFLMQDDDMNRAQPVDWMIGACYLMKRSALDNVGLFDERFFLYFEDTDLCRRFWEAGLEVWYVPEAEMVHYHQRESARYPWFTGLFSYPTRVHIASGIRYFTKYRGRQYSRER